MPQPRLLTFLDAIEHAQGFLGGAGGGSGTVETRQAVLSAYDELVMERTWNYFRRWHAITLEAPQSSSSDVATYDHADGSFERSVTLSSGTWPTNAAYYHLKLGDSATRINKIATRESSTVVTLDAELNPGADVAATTYTAFRSVYQLPSDFLQIDRPYNQNEWWFQHYISLGEAVSLEKYVNSSGPSWAFTIMGDPDSIGTMAVQFFAYPDDDRRMDIVYRSLGRKLEIDGQRDDDKKGTVALTADSATVTGTGTNFTSAMVGSIFRYSRNSSVPTSVQGLNRYGGQFTVKSVASTTSLTLHTTASETVSGRGYVVSDPLDLEQSMVNAYLKRLQYELACMRNMKNKQEHFAAYQEALATAARIDGTRVLMPRGPLSAGPRYGKRGRYQDVGEEV